MAQQAGQRATPKGVSVHEPWMCTWALARKAVQRVDGHGLQRHHKLTAIVVEKEPAVTVPEVLTN
jgi:hypothetical protein